LTKSYHYNGLFFFLSVHGTIPKKEGEEENGEKGETGAGSASISMVEKIGGKEKKDEGQKDGEKCEFVSSVLTLYSLRRPYPGNKRGGKVVGRVSLLSFHQHATKKEKKRKGHTRIISLFLEQPLSGSHKKGEGEFHLFPLTLLHTAKVN